jgi:hypothetical protein
VKKTPDVVAVNMGEPLSGETAQFLVCSEKYASSFTSISIAQI